LNIREFLHQIICHKFVLSLSQQKFVNLFLL